MVVTHQQFVIAPARWPARIARFSRVAFALLVVCLVCPANASDLAAVGDGEHVWLVIEEPEPKEKGQPQLRVYHLADEAERGQMVRLDPIDGELMRRGVTAGDGRLVIVLSNRRIEVVRPTMSPLMQRWVYERRTLPALPPDCALVSIVQGRRGPWALVWVESEKTLKILDGDAQPSSLDPGDQAELNRALGLPEDFELEPAQPADGGPAPEPSGDDAGDETDGETGDEAAASNSGVSADDGSTDSSEPVEVANDADAGDGDEDDAEDGVESESEDEIEGQPSETTTPTYRLITLRGGRWVSSPLPEGFDATSRAELVMRADDERPSILAQFNLDGSAPGELVRYTPIKPETLPDEDRASPDEGRAITDDEGATPTATNGVKPIPSWSARPVTLQSTPLGQWSATTVARQVAVVVERSRSDQAVAVEAMLLRGGEANPIGRLTLPTDGPARWSLMPWRGGVALVARPGPKLKDSGEGQEPIEPVAGLLAIGLDGQPMRDDEQDNGVVVLYEAQPAPSQRNADLLIQIGAFITAMVMMMLFYKRAPRGEQLDLPDRVELASYGRRAFAGFIDLLPGFYLAGLIYDISIQETILYWPGNGVAKVLPAMRPGFVVIAVTVVHTTICEFIFARSLGKWFTGLYVADFSGKPAPPVPALVRAVSRVFDLFAPLMLVLVVISPARQRLGDILAKTIVVMRQPDESERKDLKDED